jgi:hypothetical protein
MESLAGDLLDGAAEIAEFLWGDRKKKRRVYYLNSLGQLPLARWGDKLIGRRSTLTKYLADSEQAALKKTDRS